MSLSMDVVLLVAFSKNQRIHFDMLQEQLVTQFVMDMMMKHGLRMGLIGFAMKIDVNDEEIACYHHFVDYILTVYMFMMLVVVFCIYLSYDK